ncbi:Do family serine endopeptidase [Marinicellulosiphila megalodicopiae]|uniref:Do family serine endopeptidase n=1 Tax=Marinicellulosiphila megalodicopiae TaxID=2724896 RepID=UPI003BAED2A7
MRTHFKILLACVLTGMLVLPAMSKSLVSGLPDFTKLVEATSSSVVKITTKTNRTERSMREKEILRYFYGDRFSENIDEPVQSGIGSGFIVSQDGYILTNDHVAANSDEIEVKLNDGRVFIAKLIGTDSESDVAVLKIEAQNLPALTLADSDQLKVGEWVLAIGSPFDFDYSVTAGIVSAKGRSLPGSERFVPFIQTDVAINPGNSGGPLFNMNGEVVGINSQIYSRSGGFMGLSFAIPSNVALNVMDQLKDGGTVKRGWLGIQMEPSFNEDPQLAKSLGALNNNGALVNRVALNSPAEQAGLKAGDIITHFNGEILKKFSNLSPLVSSLKPGTTIELTVLRAGQTLNLDVILGDQENIQLFAGSASNSNILGITVRDLNKQERQLLSRNEVGVVVDQVLAQSIRQSGIETGDIITMVAGKNVSTSEQFNKAVSNIKPSQRVAMRVIRGREVFFVVIKVE